MWEAILEALLDSLKALPILLAVYVLIEFIEHKGEVKFEKMVASSKKYGPLWGAGLGCIPQCGFSAVMSDLFSKKMITIGTLFSVFVATSDEAIALLLSGSVSNGNNLISLLVLILCKLFLAIIIGYALDLIFRKQAVKQDNLAHHEHTHEHCEAKNDEKVCNGDCENCEHNTLHHKHELEDIKSTKKSTIVWHIILQGLLHTLEIFVYILIANVLIAVVLNLAGGEEVLKNIIGSNAWYSPIIAALIGLIPNCAGSVALVELYMEGIISFSACLGGLCAGAGVGLIVLYRKNKSIKQNILITLLLFVIGAAVGMLFNLFMPI